MTFWEQFLRLLPWRPGQALEALYWFVTRRKVRARNRLRQGVQTLPHAYELWISTVENNAEIATKAQTIMDSWEWRPTFTVVLHSSSDYTKEQFDRSIRSIRCQLFAEWTLVDHPVEMISTGIVSVDADYIVPLRVGDTLSESALFRFAEALQDSRSATILYGDQDELDEVGQRVRPWFKPRWNSEMFLAQDFVSSAVAINTAQARHMVSSESEWSELSLSELLLNMTAAGDQNIVHVPHILCHLDPGNALLPQHERLGEVEHQLRPLGATCTTGPFGTVKVNWPLPADHPLVSIIVPTRDRVELLSACVDSVLQKTSYRPFEIIIVDNGSVEPETLTYLAQIDEHHGMRVLRDDGTYNFSAINNRASREAKGSFLCLLNNDTEVVEPEWLTELMRQGIRAQVGAVGAKLLYDDGSIQHAGVVIGLGQAAGHAHRLTPANEPGYFRQPHVAQFVSAVTAACLLVDKAKFEAVGGLDEQQLAIAFNDVDFCLKLQAAGLKNVYVPHSVLLHHESKSRGSDLSPDQVERYMRELRVLQERWGTKTYQDPLHNPNLDPSSETFLLRL